MKLDNPLRACIRVGGGGKKILLGADVTFLSFSQHTAKEEKAISVRSYQSMTCSRRHLLCLAEL